MYIKKKVRGHYSGVSEDSKLLGSHAMLLSHGSKPFKSHNASLLMVKQSRKRIAMWADN
jgi:hypothetical protein